MCAPHYSTPARKTQGGAVSNRFLKFILSDEALWLMDHKPNAFRLLTHIARTARRTPGHPDGLLVGQCHLQNWGKYRLTQQEYRTAKQVLVKRQHIKIIKTSRTPKKSTIESTTESTTELTTASTLVQLCSNTIWDINIKVLNDSNDDRTNQPINDRATIEQRSSNDKQEGRRMKKKEKEEKEEEYARTAPRPRISDSISFDFSAFVFLGITDQDKADWRVLYPHVDLDVELLKMVHWLKSTPSKSRKKLWRKFITNWLARSNDSAENKKAYREGNKFKENKPEKPTEPKFYAGRVLKSGGA